MSTITVNIPDSWQPVIQREMAAAGYETTDGLLRAALELWIERRETREALETAVSQMKAGEGIPLEQFDREFRERNGLSPRP